MNAHSPYRQARATLRIYVNCATRAARDLVQNWPIILGSIVAYFVFIQLVVIFGGMGLAGGFLLGAAQIALLSFYYSWIAETVQQHRVKLKQLTHFEASLFFAIISVAFLIFIVDFLARPLLGDPGSRWAFWVIQLAIFILLNAVAEVIYIQRAEGIEAMGQSVNFIKENWIEWFTPLLIFFLPLLRINPSEVLVNFAQADPLIPPLPVIAEVGALLSQYAPALGIVGTVLAVAIGNWFMVFRGHLFITLAGSNRRQRIMQYG